MSKTPRRVETYWDEIGTKVLEELERRLNDGDSARDLPGTLLMRLAEKYIAYLEKKVEAETAEVPWLTPMEAIDQEGLPDDTKIEILLDYIGRLEADHVTATTRLEELRDSQTVHEPQPSAQ